MTRPANVPGTLGYARNPSPETESDLSASSDEDKDEAVSRQLLSELLDCIINYAGYHPIRSGGLEYIVKLFPYSQAMTVLLGTRSIITVRNDGGPCLTRQGGYTGSDRYGTVPLLSIEASISSCNWQGHVLIMFQAKRHHAGHIRRPAGEEVYSPDILAQEVAELSGQAIEHANQLGWRDQEAFVLSIHGTHLKLVVAHFSAQYLSYAALAEINYRAILRFLFW
jgi:hypothetical protein